MNAQDEVLILRGKLWMNGYRPVSVYSPGAVEWHGKAIVNAGKRPKGNNWTGGARQNPPEASVIKPSLDALNTGILCDGLIAVDIDADDAAIVPQIEAAALHFLGTAPKRTRADGARVLMLYRAVEGEPSKQSITGAGGKVEVLGRGQQFVAYGTHPASGAAYTWPNGAPDSFHRGTLTPVTEEAVFAFLCACAPLVGAECPKPLTNAPTPLSGAPDAAQVKDCHRNWTAGALRGKLEDWRQRTEPNSNRSYQLNEDLHDMGGYVANGTIEAQLVLDSFYPVLVEIGYVAEHGENPTKATMLGGLNSGMLKPHALKGMDIDAPADSTLETVRESVQKWIAAYKLKHPEAALNGKRRINLVRMDSIEEEAITWLWEGFLPKATLTLLGGAIQAGKSTIAMSLAATVTTGGFWPDGSRCIVPGNVIFWSSEEIVKSVVKPRLMVAGADTSRILTIESSLDEHGQPCAFDPAQDIPLLREAMMNLGSVSFVIIDPMITAVSGDTNKANDVRRSLQPIMNLAEEFDCTVLGIHHLAKNSEGKSTNDRMLGSQAFAAMARIVLVAAKDENSENRVLAISKSNISKDNGGFNYTIEGVSFPSPKGKEIKTSRIVWGEALEGSSRSILAEAEGEANEDTSKLGQAKQFLIESLATQAVGSRELLRNAREGYGISDKTLRRAQHALGIKPQHAPMFEGGWSWSLPTSSLLPECLQSPS